MHWKIRLGILFLSKIQFLRFLDKKVKKLINIPDWDAGRFRRAWTDPYLPLVIELGSQRCKLVFDILPTYKND